MKDVIKTIEENGGYITSAMAKKIGRGFYYDLLSLCEQGEVDKVKRGLYVLPHTLANTMADIDKLVPDGILCSYTAWAHYNLTTQIPIAYDVAIEAKRKVTLPGYPPINLYYWKDNSLNLGVTTETINGYHVRIYDVEKSVCDAIKLRNKIGMDVCGEILRNYLNRKDANLNKLMDYGCKLRISPILTKYLEIQVWQ